MVPTRPLLYDNYSNTSNEEDDDCLRSENEDGCNFNGRRHQAHRRSRRLTRIIMICAVLGLLLLIYTLFSNVQPRLVSIAGWGYNTSRNTADYVLPNEDTTLIGPRNICLNNFFLLIVICSSVDNFIARQNIRETWGNVTEFNYQLFSKIHSHLSGQYLEIQELSLRMHANYLGLANLSNFNESSHHENFPVKLVFLIGKAGKDSFSNETYARLRLESEQYDDLIQENFLDTYNNLTIKSIMMLKWVITKCLSRAKFLMKCDDDTFVNVPNLLHILLGGTVPVYNATVEYYDSATVHVLSPSNRMLLNQNLLTGYLFCFVKPIADTTSKWYSPIYMYSGDTYPHYLSGSSYLMSFDVIPKLYNASLNTPLLHLEDIYLTGMCAEKIHLKRRHHSLFSFGHSQNKCTYKGTITQHYLKGDLMRDVYAFVVNTTNRCPPPEKYFKVKRLRKRLKSCQ